MRKLFYLFTVILGIGSIIGSMNSCTNGSDIGDLYGRWKLRSFTCNDTTITPDTVFIGFQGDAYSYMPQWSYNWGLYEKTGSTLFLNKLQFGGTFSAIFIQEESALFNIQKCDNENLVLYRNDSVWKFKKVNM